MLKNQQGFADKNCRDEKIRTSDLQHPMLARYRATLHPEAITNIKSCLLSQSPYLTTIAYLHYMKNIIILAFFTVMAVKASAQTVIPAKEAAKHVGETVTITDKVFSGKYFENNKMTLLDIGGYNPNQLLTLMIPGADKGKFKGNPEIDYKGKPEIVVTDPSQIKLVMSDNTVKQKF